MNPSSHVPVPEAAGCAVPRWIPREPVSVVLAFLAVVLFQVLAGFRASPPEIWVHDEASYLLGADTLLQGRLANPTPESPEHFEMVHALISPAYATKYPLAQSMFLAVGKGLMGGAHRGVVLSVALAAAAAAWAGAGWAGRRGAFATGLLFAVVYGTGHYWSRSYWGGSVAAFGSFLVLGALPRLWRGWSGGAGLALGLGLSLLFLSRPYEGGVLGLVAIASLLPAVVRGWRAERSRLGRCLAVLAVLGSLTVGFQLAANRAITGRWEKLPYLKHSKEYLVAPQFWFLPIRNETLSTLPELAAVNRWEREMYREKEAEGPVKALYRFGNVAPVVSWIRFLPLLALVPAFRRRTVPGLGILVGTTLLCGFAVALETYRFEHYLAPFVAGLLLLQGMAWSEAASMARRGRWLGWVVAALLVLETRNSVRPYLRLLTRPESFPVPARRLAERRLDGETGTHLVFVRWRGEASPHQVWVANGVPLESQRILWVRDLGPEANARLRNRFPERRPWLCVPDPGPDADPSLTPLGDGTR